MAKYNTSNIKLTRYLTIDNRYILCNYKFVGTDGDGLYDYHPDGVLYYDLLFNGFKISTKEHLYSWGCKFLSMNSGISEEEFEKVLMDVSMSNMGLCIRTFSAHTIKDMADKIYAKMLLGKLFIPLNKFNKRKVIFNPNVKMPLKDKLSIVGKLCGNGRKITDEALYEFIEGCDTDFIVTNKVIAEEFKTTEQTVSRSMNGELRDYIKDHNETAKQTALYKKASSLIADIIEQRIDPIISLREMQEFLNTRNVSVIRQAMDEQLKNGKIKLRGKGEKR